MVTSNASRTSRPKRPGSGTSKPAAQRGRGTNSEAGGTARTPPRARASRPAEAAPAARWPTPARAQPSTNDIVAQGGERPKLVRDSFTMPKVEYAVLQELKLRAARLGRPAKKGELLRAGVAALGALADARFLAALAAVPTLKPGRPKQAGADAPAAAQRKGKKRRKSAG